MWRAFLAVATLSCSTACLAASSWTMAETRHFSVYGMGGADDVRRYAIQLEQYDGVLRRLSKLPPTADDPDIPRLTIIIVRNQDAVARSENSHDSSIAGYYAPLAEGCFAIVPQHMISYGKFTMTPEVILFHEYAHHFMLQNFPALYSPWFIEGFAEFHSTMQFEPDGRAVIGQPDMARLPQLKFQWGPSLARLIEPGQQPLSGMETIELYGRAWLLTHYLALSKAHAGQLETYLAARSRGIDERNAFLQAFHATPEQIDTELRAYFRANAMPYGAVQAPPPTDVRVAPVSPEEGELLLLLPRLRGLQQHDGSAKENKQAAAEFARLAKALIKDVQDVATRYPESAHVLEMQAEAQIVASDLDGAHASAQAALKIDPGLERAWLVEAQIVLSRAKKGDGETLKTARQLIAKANRANPNDPLPLLAYYQSYASHGEQPPKLAIEGLQRAEYLVPQDDRLRLALARQYADMKQFGAAATLLRPVAFAPHSSTLRDEAQKLLSALPIGQQDAPPPALDNTSTASDHATAPESAQPKS